jgi:aminoglycoside 6'-N-acetyltransferase I
MVECRKIGTEEMPAIRELFAGVFTGEPWNDDWSDGEQLDLYLEDLVGQQNSLTYGLYEDGRMVGLSMGRMKHWYTGTEYYIDELCIRTDRQGTGLGTLFLQEIEHAIREAGMVQIFLQTSADVPAYQFYRKNGFQELKGHVSFQKRI